MRILFIGMFIIALLGGITAKYVDKPGQTSWLGHIMISLGIKKQKQEADAVAANILNKSAKQKGSFDENLDDQQVYLTSTRDQISSLSLMLQERMNRDNNLDLLHLKELMKQTEDQNNLLIEHGKKLIALHNEQLELNQKLAQKAGVEAIVSDSDRNRFVQNIKDNISHQQDMLNQQGKESMELKNKMQQIHNQIEQMHDSLSSKEDPEFVEKLKSLSEKSQDVFNNVKQRQQQLFNMNETNLNSINSSKEKIQDLKQRINDTVEQNRQKAGH